MKLWGPDHDDALAATKPLELNIATTLLHAASVVPDRPAIVQGSSSMSYVTLDERSRKLARFLADRGLNDIVPRARLANHESGQSFFGQYLYNCPEYIEGMFGSFIARVAPFNINYRYGADEIRYLLGNAAPRVVQYHATFAPVFADALRGASVSPLLLQVADASGNELLPGAIDYGSAIDLASGDVLEIVPSPDDLHVLYTGGTTGMPKGVLWQQAEVAVAAMSLVDRRSGGEWQSLEDRESYIQKGSCRMMACPPFIHGAAQWNGLQTLCDGDTMVLTASVDHFDAREVYETIERERVDSLSLVGDAFAGLLVRKFEKGTHDLGSLKVMFNSGAMLRPSYESKFVEMIPGLRVLDFIGSSESGTQGQMQHSLDRDSMRFEQRVGTAILSGDLFSVVEPGDQTAGWLARSGRVPLGYLGDKEKTAKTFPVVDGIRYTVPGDRARYVSDKEFEPLGRDSVTINTGGEKVFGEEVELALKELSEVVDVLVCGRPSDRWGQEVVAIVVLQAGASVDPQSLKDACRRRLAGYKTP